MGKISAHVLDTARGRPASDLSIRLDLLGDGGVATRIGEGVTNADGRVSDLSSGHTLEAGTYRVVFETEPYLVSTEQAVFYPRVEVVFCIAAPGESYHIPLLLSPYGYSTYRGS